MTFIAEDLARTAREWNRGEFEVFSPARSVFIGRVRTARLLIVSDIHYAGATERARAGFEHRAVDDAATRMLLRFYRRFIWLAEPTEQGHLLDQFIARAGEPDLVVANGDFSCDSAFVGVSDDAACASAVECLGRLRGAFGGRFAATIGDHELGKTSLVGNKGGMRLASWERTLGELQLKPAWRVDIGRYALLGVTSTLVGLPVFVRDILPGEHPAWDKLRAQHLAEVRDLFAGVEEGRRIVLFCHDPSALPFLAADEVVRAKLPMVEQTIVGHLHSNLFLSLSRLLAGMPPVSMFGKSIERYSVALNRARHWRPFNVRLCPALPGIQLLNDGGFYEVELDTEAMRPAKFTFRPLPR